MRKIQIKILIRKIILLIVCMLFVFVLYTSLKKARLDSTTTSSSTLNETTRKMKHHKEDVIVNYQGNNFGCKMPRLPTSSPDLMKFVLPINCSMAGFDWVKCVGFTCLIQNNVKLIHGPIKCAFTDIIRVDDFTFEDGLTTYSDSYYKLNASDVVRVSCTSSTEKWEATLTGLRYDANIFNRTSNLPNTIDKMNVLMLGFASLSPNAFIKKLPKTYNYLVKILNGDVLTGYNIIGYGTSHSLIPILTGKIELELPDTRKRFPETEHVDVYPLIWKKYKKAGYVTAFMEDRPELGAFTERLNGFQNIPTDHYMRHYYLASFAERKKWPKLCIGETPRHKIMLNQIRDFFTVYEEMPKFMFAFHSELSHDNHNLIEVADNDLYELLKELNESGALDKTLLILMSDHGQKMDKNRITIEGKQEERLPFFSIAFPDYFKTNYPFFYSTFRWNVAKLTTPFDIYKTLNSLLRLDIVRESHADQRSFALFIDEVPWTRKCVDAFIEPQWCACLDWHELPTDAPAVKQGAETVLNAVNNETQPFRDKCQLLKISCIQWAYDLKPNDHLIKFNGTLDFDGFMPDSSAKMSINTNLYLISVVLQPLESIFEASVTHFLHNNRFEVKISDISSFNLYSMQGMCLENELQNYCYCIQQ